MDFDDRSPLLTDPARRPEVTLEREPSGTTADPGFPDVDWIGTAQQGGGHVPADFQWRSEPKQEQDEAEGG